MNSYEYNHYKSNIDINNTNDSRSIIYSLIEDNTNILDLGCACGDLGNILKNKNCNIYGLEYLEECVLVASKTNAYIEVNQCDLDTFNAEDYKKYERLFDYIVLGDVLEHLYNPIQLLAKIKKFLKDDGCFIVSIPNMSHASIKISLLLNQFNYLDYGILDKTHIHFFTLESFLNEIKKLDLYIKNFNYTVTGIKGSIENLKYQKLPLTTLFYIINDNQSFCFQYIFKLSKQNLLNINNTKGIITKSANYNLLKKTKNNSYLKLIKKILKIGKQ